MLCTHLMLVEEGRFINTFSPSSTYTPFSRVNGFWAVMGQILGKAGMQGLRLLGAVEQGNLDYMNLASKYMNLSLERGLVNRSLKFSSVSM